AGPTRCRGAEPVDDVGEPVEVHAAGPVREDHEGQAGGDQGREPQLDECGDQTGEGGQWQHRDGRDQERRPGARGTGVHAAAGDPREGPHRQSQPAHRHSGVSSRAATTGPMTVIAGGAMPPSSAAEAMPVNGARTTRCCGVAPSAMLAAGVSAGSPAARSASAIAPSVATPMSTTIVRPEVASPAQSTSLRGSSGVTCPETTATPWESPRWVVGMPARAGTDRAEETPGTTSTGTPAVVQT